jgi:hypothetical protein
MKTYRLTMHFTTADDNDHWVDWLADCMDVNVDRRREQYEIVIVETMPTDQMHVADIVYHRSAMQLPALHQEAVS